MGSLLAFFGVFVIGLSKAGFATGLGMLSTPLMAQALPARTAIGVILPLLCLADVFTLAVYWRRWDLRLVAWPLVGTLLGIASATAFVTSISEMALRRSIGGVGLVLTLLLVIRNRYHPHAVYRPGPGTASSWALPPGPARRSPTRRARSWPSSSWRNVSRRRASWPRPGCSSP
jgi:uncharacterized membrane protein YfcA